MPFFEGRKRRIEKKIEGALPIEEKKKLEKKREESEEKVRQTRLEEERKEKERIEQEMKEKEETVKGISGYLKEHKQEAATRYFEEKIRGIPGKELKEYEKKAKEIIELEENFLKGKVDKKHIEMIEKTPTVKEGELRAKGDKADEKYIHYHGLWREAKEGSEDKTDYKRWFEEEKEKYNEYGKEREGETSNRERWLEVLKSGKLSREEIKEVLSGQKDLEEIELKEAPRKEE